MNSPFSSVLSGDDRRWVIAENDLFIAVLETRPIAPGHVVVISKVVEDHLLRLGDHALGELMPFAKRIANALERVVKCQKVGIAVIGLETRHAHLHLVPLNSADDLNFTRPKLSIDEGELSALLEKLKLELS